MKKKRKFLSIRLKFTLIFILILAGILGSIILVNANFLESYTIQKKVKRIQEIVLAVENYADDEWSSEAETQLEKLTRNSNINVIIIDHIDTTPQIVYASNLNDGGMLSGMMHFSDRDGREEDDIYAEGENYVIFKRYNSRLDYSQIDCMGMINEEIGFMLSTPLQSIRETVELTNGFLVILGLLVGLIGAIIIYLVTSSLTRPIKELSRISEEMAELNFDARYSGKSKNELGILGDNMNYLSQRLEETIANLRSANIQLEKDLEEKDRIDEMRRVFLSNVSHELKTPIALIQGYSEGLKDGISVDPDSMDYYCDVIIDEAQKMNNIVKRLLNLDEIETGEIQVQKEVFNLSEVLEGVARSSKMLADKECNLNLLLDPLILVHADEFMIEQVVQNYLSNAYHYVDADGTVTIEAHDQGGKVHVAVHNTGSHIPEEDIEHIWEKFYKVDKARTRSYGGSGIGLSIVKAIMDNHKSPFGVLNRDNGVEFWFELDTLTEDEANAIEEMM